ncbi:MAG: hypothetical protein ABIN01_25955 [Ferruginibacter sp.]
MFSQQNSCNKNTATIHRAKKSLNAFTLVAHGKATALYVDPSDDKGVMRAAYDLGDDIKKASGTAAVVKLFGRAYKQKNITLE